MADYNYADGGRITNGKSRLGTRYQAWDTTHDGFKSNGDAWSQQSYATIDEGRRDHVCRPVIVDADGKTRPAFVILPAHHHNGDEFATKTETVTEYVYATSPVIAPTNIYATKQPTKDLTVSNNVNATYPASAPTNVYATKQPMKDLTVPNNVYATSPTSAPTNTYATRQPMKDLTVSNNLYATSPVSAQTNGFTTRQPMKDLIVSNNRSGWPGGPFRDQTPKFEEYTGRDQTSPRNYPWIGRASGTTTTTQQPNFGGSVGRNELVPDSVNVPTVINQGGLIRPSRFGFRTPMYQESSLGKPTNDIGSAIDYVRESTRSPSVIMTPPQSRFSASPFTSPTNAGTIDSKELAQRYNGKFM